MKNLISLALILQITVLTQVSFATGAAAGSPSNKKNPQPRKSSSMGTSFKFDGSALRGKYNSSMSTAATVENDKLLEDLLKGRTQFADRLEKETERN